MTVTARRRERSWTLRAPAPPSEVFPLLCPVREHDWIEGWDCEMVFSDSGIAELGCVFTRTDETGPAVWVVTRYEPDERIEFVITTPGSHVQHLVIRLEPDGDGSAVHWTRTITALSPDGGAAVEALDDGSWETRMAGLEGALQHYLTTGEMLQPGA